MPKSSYQSISLRLNTTFSMFSSKSPALSTLLALLAVLHTALASPPLRPRFERRQNDPTVSTNPTGTATTCSLGASCGGSVFPTSINATSALNSNTLSSRSAAVTTGSSALNQTALSAKSASTYKSSKKSKPSQRGGYLRFESNRS